MSKNVWVRTHDGGLIRATEIDELTHAVTAPTSGYVVKAVSNGNPIVLIDNTTYAGTTQDRQAQAKAMQDSLPLAVDHGAEKMPTYVVSYDDTAERWNVEQIQRLQGVFQPVVV